MNYVIFDLEWNGCFSKKTNSHINEIIEIGAVKLNDKTDIIGKFNCLVRPVISRSLSSQVMELTDLTFEDLKKGVPFDYGYSKFRKFADGCVLMSWSTSDIETLLSNLKFHKKMDTIPFMKKYADLQQYCHDMMGLYGTNAVGLQTAAEMLSLDTEEIHQHRALGDSIVTAMCFRRLYHKAVLETYIQDSSCRDFYERLFFHPAPIEEEDSPLIDLENVFFNCPECGARCIRKEPLVPKFKGFAADHVCPVCGYDFIGRVSYKQKIDGVIMTKKVLKHLPAEEN